MKFKAFTLAELLIALGILGVIATFTIPKVLTAQNDSKFKAIAKETAGSVSDAFQRYRYDKGVSSTFSFSDLTPYLNYVRMDSVSDIDSHQGNMSVSFSCSSPGICLKLHNGAMLDYIPGKQFGGTGSLNSVYFYLDPDGKVTDGTTNGPGKTLMFWLYADGSIRNHADIKVCSTDNSGACAGPCPSCQPPWFSWN